MKDQTHRSGDRFTYRVLLSAGITVLVVFVVLWLWYVAEALLLVFVGILLAVFLRGLAELLSAHAPVSVGWALALVVLAFFSGTGAGLWLLGPPIIDGINGLLDSLPQALARLDQSVRQYEWGQRILAHVAQMDRLLALAPETIARVTGIFSTAIGALISLFIITVTGLYVSAEPGVYINGIVRLVPPHRRMRARQIFTLLGHALRWWLVSRIASMLVVGALTWVGLLALGTPFALTLAMVAALLSFIPNIGPILSAVPAVLIGLTVSPTMALYVMLLYIGVQTIETYLITPLIQRSIIAMPPALLMTAQLAMGVPLGVLGLLVAAPLTLVLLVLVETLYIQDTLGESAETP